MANYTLSASSPLNGIRLDYPNLTIEEVARRALVSIAVPHGGGLALEAAIRSAYGNTLPATGNFATTARDNAIILNLAPDQYFIVFDAPEPAVSPVSAVREHLGQSAYLADQSDAWVMIRLSGVKSRAALERTCPLDLNAAVFNRGRVARTVMEHLATIIICEDENRFLLLSPSSSAVSFMHVLETSARNVT